MIAMRKHFLKLVLFSFAVVAFAACNTNTKKEVAKEEVKEVVEEPVVADTTVVADTMATEETATEAVEAEEETVE